jgi:hypothetical protein
LGRDFFPAEWRGFAFDFLAPFLVVEAIEKIEMGLTCLLRQRVAERQGRTGAIAKERNGDTRPL